MRRVNREGKREETIIVCGSLNDTIKTEASDDLCLCYVCVCMCVCVSVYLLRVSASLCERGTQDGVAIAVPTAPSLSASHVTPYWRHPVYVYVYMYVDVCVCMCVCAYVYVCVSVCFSPCALEDVLTFSS